MGEEFCVDDKGVTNYFSTEGLTKDFHRPGAGGYRGRAEAHGMVGEQGERGNGYGCFCRCGCRCGGGGECD